MLLLVLTGGGDFIVNIPRYTRIWLYPMEGDDEILKRRNEQRLFRSMHEDRETFFYKAQYVFYNPISATYHFFFG